MARACPTTELEVPFKGRDIGWLLNLCKYALEEQIEIRDKLAIAEKTTFLLPVLDKLEIALVRLQALEEHWAYMQDSREFFGDMDRIDEEIKRFKAIAFGDIERQLVTLNERLQETHDIVDARCLQHFLRLTFE